MRKLENGWTLSKLFGAEGLGCQGVNGTWEIHGIGGHDNWEVSRAPPDLGFVCPPHTAVSDNFPRWREGRTDKQKTGLGPSPILSLLCHLELWSYDVWEGKKRLRFLPLLKFCFKNKKNQDFLMLKKLPFEPIVQQFKFTHTMFTQKEFLCSLAVYFRVLKMSLLRWFYKNEIAERWKVTKKIWRKKKGIRVTMPAC